MTYEVPLLVIKDDSEICSEMPKRNFDGPSTVDIGLVDKIDETVKANSGTKRQFIFPDRSSLGLGENEKLLRPYTVALGWRKLPKAIVIDNELVSRYKALKVVEYLDQTTGEIIQASDARNDPRLPQQIYVGEIQLLRESLMASLRKEVREFALFILRFRNSRRGISPEINTIVDWYAMIHGKRPSNVRRYVKALHEASFLAGESLLSPLFQRTGKTTISKDHLGEDSAARSTLMKIRMKSKIGRDSSPILAHVPP